MNRNPRYALARAIIDHTIPKPHAHFMMMQMNIREGIKKIGNKGNEGLTKNQTNYMNDKPYCQKEKKTCPMTKVRRPSDT